jgi:hypothetical protein
MYRLKRAYDAGYYRTEPAADEQTPFPWQNKFCRDCPFWSDGFCFVFGEYRGPLAHTCTYFNPVHREAAQRIIQDRHSQAFHR